MKKYLFLLLTLFVFTSISAQQLPKSTLKQIEKDSKKAAKDFEKQGWKVLPGSLSIQMQEMEAMKATMERDNLGDKKYIVERGQSSGETYNAAKLGAIQAAKLQIATSLEQEFAGNLTQLLANNGAAGVSVESVESNIKSIIDKKLGKVITLTEMYQQKGPKEYIVSVTVAYDNQQAIEIAKESIRQALEEETRNLK